MQGGEKALLMLQKYNFFVFLQFLFSFSEKSEVLYLCMLQDSLFCTKKLRIEGIPMDHVCAMVASVLEV